ncbi:helix-turn-helix transcriptional regulator [Lysobacter firmicutimachus]|uniref:Helix-turn-helix transcriptional regulator n=1 Tax=Lysobacter firmicutimachus TaxID=1792846 RepID=A0AAU8MK40_9GAMM|nr:helix-turn-helix transcriptional regulator [Lysobacter antibioticus]
MPRKHRFHYPYRTLPGPLLLRYEALAVDTESALHRHPWGQLAFVESGSMAFLVEGRPFFAPPGYAVWIPPRMDHSSHNRREVHCRLINIAERYTPLLPAAPGIVRLHPLFIAGVEDLFARGVEIPDTPADRRLARVLIDKLLATPMLARFVPQSEDRLLAPILDALQHRPGDNTTLAQWAQRVHTTERTLSRRCRDELGMSFSQWRQRLRFQQSIPLLEQGRSVQQVAADMGYASASAFIAMFNELSGSTPLKFRQGAGR